MTTTDLAFDPKKALSQEAKAAKGLAETLRQHPDFQGEELDEAVSDAVEGETQLNEVCAKLLRHALYLEAQAKGVQQYMDDLRTRKQRMEDSAGTLRAMVLQAMEVAGIKSVKDATLTASTRPVAPTAIIEDEVSIPSDYFVPQDPRIDKNALTADLKEGREIPGARLSNGGYSLTIRTK